MEAANLIVFNIYSQKGDSLFLAFLFKKLLNRIEPIHLSKIVITEGIDGIIMIGTN